MTLAKAQPCLSRKQNRASRERKKTRFFSVFERHGHAFRGSKTVPLAEAKPCLSWLKKHVLFSFPRGIARKHNRASRGSKERVFSFIREARSCLFRKRKKNMVPILFFPGFLHEKNRQDLSTWHLVLNISMRGIHGENGSRFGCVV